MIHWSRWSVDWKWLMIDDWWSCLLGWDNRFSVLFRVNKAVALPSYGQSQGEMLVQVEISQPLFSKVHCLHSNCAELNLVTPLDCFQIMKYNRKWKWGILDKLFYGKLAGGGVFRGMDGEIYQAPNPNYWTPVKGAFLERIHNHIKSGSITVPILITFRHSNHT